MVIASGVTVCSHKKTDSPSQTETITTTVSTTKRVVEPAVKAKKPYAQSELDYMAAIIYQEAGAYYLSDYLRQCVGEVVMNRVKSDLFPNNIYSVLTQRGQYGMMWKNGVNNLARGSDAVEKCYEIADKVLRGSNEVPDNVVFQAEFKQGSGVWKVIDGVYFCYV